MKLHLPISFRKALLACLASLVVPSVSVATGAFFGLSGAAGFEPTLDGLHQENAEAYPNSSAYSLSEATEDDKDAICIYETAEDGSLTPRYYRIEMAAFNPQAPSAQPVVKEYHWITTNDGKLTLVEKADSSQGGAFITYQSQPANNGAHISYTGSVAFGASSGKTKSFVWKYEDFGAKEGFEDSETVDNWGMPENPAQIVPSDSRWFLREAGNGEAGYLVTFTYSPDGKHDARVTGESGKIEGVFEELSETEQNKYDWGNSAAVPPAAVVVTEVKGGAVFYDDNDTGSVVNATFVDNSVINNVVIKEEISQSWDITNKAFGGALYNSGQITQGVQSDFAGNSAQTLFGQDGTNLGLVYAEDENDAVKITNQAAGGAIYNLGTIGAGGIDGVFIGNGADAKLRTLEGINSHTYAKVYFDLRAEGGAIYNAGTISGVISGNFISNYARNLLTMGPAGGASYVHIPKFLDYAMGGAIYNGIEGSGSGSSYIQGIDGSFVGNFAHVYHLTQYGSAMPIDFDPWVMFDGKYSTMYTYAAGGAVYNGISDVQGGGGGAISSSIGSIAGTYIDNYVYDVDPYVYDKDNRDVYGRIYQLGDWGVYKHNRVAGGAIYNGIANVEESSGNLSASIGELSGVYTGNYVYVKTYKVRMPWSGTYTDNSTLSLLAAGGAVYSGVADVEGNGTFSTAIRSVDGTFTGNYALAKRSFQRVDGVTLGTGYTFEQEYSFGGAVYNGIADVKTESGKISSSIDEKISGVYEGNYASVDTNSYNGLAYAAGGALYSGLTEVDINGKGEASTSIGKVENATFTGNYALVTNTMVSNTGNQEDYAMGGAIYNGISRVSVSGGVVSADIGGITTAAFTGNYAETRIGIGAKYYALGGAVYNGITDIEGGTEGSIGATIDSISAADGFVGNYVKNANATGGTLGNGDYYALGGAIYNGIQSVDQSSGAFHATVGSIDADFFSNYAMGRNTQGGAIYNGVGLVRGSGETLDNQLNTGYYSIFYYKEGLNQEPGIFTESQDVTSDAFIDKSKITSIQKEGEYKLDNKGGELGSSVGVINGQFTENYVAGTKTADGGAIANILGNISGSDGGENMNKQYVRLWYAPQVNNGTGIEINYRRDALEFNFKIDNQYNGVIDNSEQGTILSHIEGIVGDFSGNHADFIENYAGFSSGAAHGGAIYNSLGSIGASSDDVTNDSREVRLHHDSGNGGVKGSSDITLHYEDVITSVTSTKNVYRGAIDNSNGGVIGSSIGAISGHFKANYVAAQTASGGAIFNNLGDIAASKGKVSNLIGNNESISFGLKSDNSTGVSVTYAEMYKNSNTIENEYRGEIINTNGGKIAASVGAIIGDFVENYVSGTRTKAGAIYNSLGSITASNGTVENKNIIGIKHADTLLNNGKIENDFQGSYEVSNSIVNSYIGTIDNKGGEISASVESIIGDFVKNHAVSSGNSSADGGAIYNSIENITVGKGQVTSTNSVSEGAAGAAMGGAATFKSANSIRDEFIGEIDNSSGRIEASIGGITGHFIGNYVAGTIVKGGAIANSLGSITVIDVSIHNENDINVDKMENESSIVNTIGATFNNAGGYIGSSIDSLKGDYVGNYAEAAVGATGTAQGGAIYNGIDSISGGKIALDGDGQGTIKHTVKAAFNNDGGRIESRIGSVAGNFYDNYAKAASAKGGAIYNGIGSVSGYDINGDAAGDTITTTFSNEGGVISARIGTIAGNYVGNLAVSTESKGDAKGGAIYNGGGDIDPGIGGVVEAKIDSITGSFIENRAVGASAFGGAIFNGGRIDRIFSTNEVRKGDPLAGFIGNSADVSGGALYNEGSIGGIHNMSFTGNTAKFSGSSVSKGGMALTNTGVIGEIKDDATTANGDREYDNTILDGIVNSNFTDNTSTKFRARAAALYTETDLAIIADAEQAGSADVVFRDNHNNETKDSDIYVGSNGDAPATVYMIAKTRSSITTHGEINGEAGYTLRLRGFTERVEGDVYATHGGAINGDGRVEKQDGTYDDFQGGGLISFQGLVRGADVIMDDVTLLLGRAHNDEDYLTVYEDMLAGENGRLSDDHELHPGDIIFDGSYGGVKFEETHDGERRYSDVLRESSLELRSGHVMTNRYVIDENNDYHVINYNIGSLVSNGYLSCVEENGGYYKTTDMSKALYGTWSVCINLNELNANTITTWVDPAAGDRMTRGYITLSGISVLAKYKCGYDTKPFGDWWNEREISPYLDVTIQVINLLEPGQTGGEKIAEDHKWRKEGGLDDSAPLQLDLSLLQQKVEATVYMTSNDILCEGYGYATTKTYHDSIRIWGWRDNLAAWAELQPEQVPQLLSADDAGHEYTKEFFVIGEQVLTRNVRRLENELGAGGTLLQGTNFMIHGKSIAESWLNVNGFNLLSEIAEGQTMELRNLAIFNVGTNAVDEKTGEHEEGWNRIKNEGELIMDTLLVENPFDTPESENNLVVQNDNKVYKRGDWGIGNIFTSGQRATASALPERAEDFAAPTRLGTTSAGKPSEGITNELHLQANDAKQGTTYIHGTVEYQNIIHEEGAETHLNVHTGADRPASVTDKGALHTPQSGVEGGVTEAFSNFYGNSLTMKGGDFYLNNLNFAELKLRELNLEGGTIHINSVSVDLSASPSEGTMGRIWAFDNATYTGGTIFVGNADAATTQERIGLKVMRDKDTAGMLRQGEERYYNGAAHYAIPVQFVNPEVADAVVPFGKEGDHDAGTTKSAIYKMESTVRQYDVDYDYTTGAYTFRWMVGHNDPDSFTPGTLVGETAQSAGGFASMVMLNEHVFEHADLFSANMYNAQKARLRERSFTVITPVKGGKNAAPRREPAKKECSHLAGFKGGMWVRPYAGYEMLPLKHGPKVSNYLYGALVGGDSAVTEHKNGWASVFSAHAAYMGSTQRYSGALSSARIHQNGGAVGVTETLYKRGFYTAVSASLGTSSAHANTSAGTENFHMLMGSVASRSGYNVELAKGKLLLQPTLMVSYTMLDTANYTNAAGARITSELSHTLQVNPYLKLIVNTSSCWQPYATVGYVHNFFGETRFHADGILLPEMSIKPYTEYSIGTSRSWDDKYTIFGEVKGRNGGRNGVEFSAGIRCAW